MVKLSKIGDSTRYIVGRNENNEPCYYSELNLTFEVQGEACARAIVDAGISRVYYGRAQSISDETAKIFYAYGVEVIHVSDWEEEDVVE